MTSYLNCLIGFSFLDDSGQNLLNIPDFVSRFQPGILFDDYRSCSRPRSRVRVGFRLHLGDYSACYVLHLRRDLHDIDACPIVQDESACADLNV